METKDIPGTRSTLRYIAIPGVIYFFLAMALLGSVTFILGMLILGAEGPGPAVQIHDNELLPLIGILAFAFFFPWYMILYFARHLLISIERLEAAVQPRKEDGTHAKDAAGQPL